MRFDRSSLQANVLLIISTYILYLGVRQDLDLYIHPRYIVFTIVLAGIGFIMTSLYAVKSKNTAEHDHGSKMLLVPLFFLLAAGLLLPGKTLSSATVSQRTTDAGSIVATTDSGPVDTLFAGSSRGLRLRDWSQILATNNDPAFYATKPAKVSGFVFDAGLGDDTVWLARFVLTCCAVDAQPVGVPVQIENWQQTYEEDQWLEVEGVFRLADTDDGEQIVLIPDTIEEINQPDNPYAN